MVTWAAFQEQAGALGAFAGERVEGPGLVLVATLRRDGWPRISPVEPLLFDGRLYLGMMWRSTKALDLLRDPRVLVHSVVSRKDGSEGDVKVYGRALEVRDPDERERYCVALQEKIGWRPEGWCSQPPASGKNTGMRLGTVGDSSTASVRMPSSRPAR